MFIVNRSFYNLPATFTMVMLGHQGGGADISIAQDTKGKVPVNLSGTDGNNMTLVIGTGGTGNALGTISVHVIYNYGASFISMS